MIKKYSLIGLQTAINHLLSLDEEYPSKIAPLASKVMKVTIKPLNVDFFITFNNRQIQLLDNWNGTIDTCIESSPLGLIRLSLLPASKARSLFNDQIKLSGDVEAGQQLKKLIDELDIDWETHLAHFTGDVVAYQLGSLFKKGASFTNQLTRSMRQNMTDYLQEELRVAPCKEEINNFLQDIDTLSMDVERLQATINLLILKTNEIT